MNARKVLLATYANASNTVIIRKFST